MIPWVKRGVCEVREGNRIKVWDKKLSLYFYFNEDGAELWEQIDGTNTVLDLIDFFYEKYKKFEKREKIEGDILNFLNELEQRGWIIYI